MISLVGNLVICSASRATGSPQVDVDVNATNKAGLTPLHEACQAGQEDCLELLLEFPAVDVNRHAGPVCACGHVCVCERMRAREGGSE